MPAYSFLLCQFLNTALFNSASSNSAISYGIWEQLSDELLTALDIVSWNEPLRLFPSILHRKNDSDTGYATQSFLWLPVTFLLRMVQNTVINNGLVTFSFKNRPASAVSQPSGGSSELAKLVPLPHHRHKSTLYSGGLHDFLATIPRYYKYVYANLFFPRTARLYRILYQQNAFLWPKI